ncbi:MAG: hypothetical protein IPN59_09395 [Holophaga sp.]|nr:hypothetical protein [Holophaga sp.]
MSLDRLTTVAKRWLNQARTLKRFRAAAALGIAVVGISATQVPWTELTEADWIYAIATRFSLVEGHRGLPHPHSRAGQIAGGSHGIRRPAPPGRCSPEPW